MIDTLKSSSDSTYGLFDNKTDMLNFTNLMKECTCLKPKDGTLIAIMLAKWTQDSEASELFSWFK